MRLERGKLLQRTQSALRAIFLDESDDGVQHDDREDRSGVFDLPDHTRDDRSAEKHQDHEIGELRQQHLPRAATILLADLVAAVPGEALGGLVRRQPNARFIAKLRGGLRGRQYMPSRRRPNAQGRSRCVARGERHLRQRFTGRVEKGNHLQPRSVIDEPPYGASWLDRRWNC